MDIFYLAKTLDDKVVCYIFQRTAMGCELKPALLNQNTWKVDIKEDVDDIGFSIQTDYVWHKDAKCWNILQEPETWVISSWYSWEAIR